jgi:gamma-glutamyltranspeptidase/glutathione hydrolase
MIDLLDFQMPIADAVESPRVHFERGLLNIEPGFGEAAEAVMREDYPEHELWTDRNLFFGGVHAVRVEPRGRNLEGAGDPRRGGVSLTL